MRHCAAARTCFRDVFERTDLQGFFGARSLSLRASAGWRHRAILDRSCNLDLMADVVAQLCIVAAQLIHRAVLSG